MKNGGQYDSRTQTQVQSKQNGGAGQRIVQDVLPPPCWIAIDAVYDTIVRERYFSVQDCHLLFARTKIPIVT